MKIYRKSVAASSRRRRHPLLIEAVEPRRLLAASLNGNVLQITGTAVADAYTVTLSGTNLVVQRAGEAAQSFAKAAVAKIVATLGGGNDSILINDAVNTPASLSGEAGDDTLRGGTGNDTIDGGDGTDTVTYAGRTAGVTASVKMTVYQDAAAQDPQTGLYPTVINGNGTGGTGSEADTYRFVETIAGGAGNDSITLADDVGWFDALPNVALRGEGGGGNDRLYVSTYGSYRNNNFTGVSVVADGGSGDDFFRYGNDIDIVDATLVGGDGNDTFEKGNDDASAWIDAGAGVDTWTMYASSYGAGYSMPSDLENFTVTGRFYNSVVRGNELDNVISVFGGKVYGGGGNDRIDFRGPLGDSSIPGQAYGEGGNDSIVGSVSNDTIDGGTGDDTLVGGAGDDALYGGDGNDRLDPGSGNDFVDGGNGGGNAVVYSGRNVPVTGTLSATLRAITGGYTVDRAFVATLTENGYAETDTGVNVEVLVGGNGSDTLTAVANAGAWQSAGATTYRPTLLVNGGWGNDTLTVRGALNPDGTVANTLPMIALGGDGNDALTATQTTAAIGQLDGGNNDDTLTYSGDAGYFSAAGGAGKDTLRIANRSYKAPVITVTLAGDVEDATVDAGVRVDVVGNALANTISVNAPGTSVKGLGGNDTIVGSESADSLDGGDGDDSIVGNGGNDTLWGFAGNDRLFGNGGLDKLYGGIGNDFFDGGAGVDSLYGEAGTDTAVRDWADLVDSIETFV